MDEAQDAHGNVEELAAAIEAEFGVPGGDARGLAATILRARST